MDKRRAWPSRGALELRPNMAVCRWWQTANVGQAGPSEASSAYAGLNQSPQAVKVVKPSPLKMRLSVAFH